MRSTVRAYMTVLLAIMVAASGIGHAQARHQAHGATTLVICTGYGLVTVTIDNDGNPVEHTLPCPDCTLAQGALLADPATLLLPDLCARDTVLLRASWSDPSAAGVWHQSRAPPRALRELHHRTTTTFRDRKDDTSCTSGSAGCLCRHACACL